MAMPIIPKAIYPLVPNVAGVPALLRSAAVIVDSATFGLLGLSDALSSLIGSEPVQWGIFDDTGVAIAVSDTTISFQYRNSSKVSDYPVEQGGFDSFNKVADPFDIKVRLVCGGDEDRRSAFIDALDEAANSLDLYSVLTPERTFDNANIESWDFKRELSNGAYVIIADVYLREIRESATAAFSTPKSVSAAPVQSQGQVQAAPVTSAQNTAIISAARQKTAVKQRFGASGTWSNGASGSWGSTPVVTAQRGISTGGASGGW